MNNCIQCTFPEKQLYGLLSVRMKIAYADTIFAILAWLCHFFSTGLNLGYA